MTSQKPSNGSIIIEVNIVEISLIPENNYDSVNAK
jgi:hypothetical protein